MAALINSGQTALRPVLEFGIASFPMRGETECGDRHAVVAREAVALVAAVDGGGHGREAAVAAQTAVAVLERHADEGVLALVNLCHEALKRTRGATMSLAVFDGRQDSLTWLGVGNVEGVVFQPLRGGGFRRETLFLRGGSLGHTLPRLVPKSVPVKPGDVLIFTTDGVRAQADLDRLLLDPPQQIAERICSQYGKDTDDRLALVVRYLGDGLRRRSRRNGKGEPPEETHMKRKLRFAKPVGEETHESTTALLTELVAHLRQNRTQLREEWARRITESQLLTAMTKDEVFKEATAVYDNYVAVLETGSVEALQEYARDLSERIIPRGVQTHEVLGIVLLLRDVLARSLFKKYQSDFGLLNEVLDAYEPAANRIANTVGVSFVQERERIIRQQEEAIRELSTPVLQVRERLLILPIIGVIDPQRARQLTEQLLRGIRTNRARVVVIDITGVPSVDSTVANHLVQTVDASRLMGATVIVTGLSSEIAQTLVTIGVDLTKMRTVGDLQGGIEEAERLLGYQINRVTT